MHRPRREICDSEGRIMLEQDYLMRIFLQFAEIIRRSWTKARKEKDPRAAADMLEDAVGEATEIDGGVLLSLSPESSQASCRSRAPTPASPNTSRAACFWLQDICAKRTNKPWPTCARSRHMPLRRRTAFLCPNALSQSKNCSTTFMARFRKRTTRCSRCPGSRRKCWGPIVQPSRCWRRRRTMPRQAADGRRHGRPLTICRNRPQPELTDR